MEMECAENERVGGSSLPTTSAAVSDVKSSSGSYRDYLSSFLIVVGGCAILCLIVDRDIVVSPRSVVNFSTLWIASVALGCVVAAFGIPPLLGSLIAGILLQNVPINDRGFFEQVSPFFRETIQTVGLCTILLISSTEIDVHAVARAGGVPARLAFAPALVEAAAAGAASHWIFGMPPALALSLGFVLAAVSPAIVVPGMTSLQRQGYGVEKGIPSLVMAACAFDDIAAIAGFTICIGIAMNSRDNLLLNAFLHGPVCIFLGVVSGCVGGFALAASEFCPHHWQRTAIAIELALLMTYAYKRAGIGGSGSIG